MNIEFLEIQNFRKLKSIRVDFAKKTTVFVGANNSGKTTAMVALGHFLIDTNRFTTNDFTLSNWSKINQIGVNWEENETNPVPDIPNLSEWADILPALDVWLNVTENEVHYVRHLIPTLAWNSGNLGVRLRLEPKKIEDFYADYLIARNSAKETIKAAREIKENSEEYTLPLFPTSMGDYLAKNLKTYFIVRAYILDPKKIQSPQNGIAVPQLLDINQDHLEENPFKGLIRIDEIDAQRGFSDSNTTHFGGDEGDTGKSNKGKLSSQLRSYYSQHIDPSEMPDPSDLDALQAIHNAQGIFDEKLSHSFSSAFLQLGNLGYPGFSDLELMISTKIRPMDGLNHPSALQYKVASDDTATRNPTLPEDYNGLGYQNLISMVFRLMGFRDRWMHVGKSVNNLEKFIPPLHLVLVEEPEAHLHVQVQQVFIRKAYEILRNHDDLKEDLTLTTQLIVTTHSSHIAHECDFSWLRYFKRRPAIKKGEVPTSTVVNLSEVFGDTNETQKFVTRYLKTTHCDLFFADAAILVEGPAERMLVPHFIRENFETLNQSYITILEINGSHAHRLIPLLNHLGLISLIITDLDASEITNKRLKSVAPKRKSSLVTGNYTLRQWEETKSLDHFFDLNQASKIKPIDDFALMRLAYQIPVLIDNPLKPTEKIEALPNTFEDAFVFDNIMQIKGLTARRGLLKIFKKAINSEWTSESLGKEMFDALKEGDKAEFALEILFQEEGIFNVPTYIKESLDWLQEQLKKKQLEVLIEETQTLEIQ